METCPLLQRAVRGKYVSLATSMSVQNGGHSRQIHQSNPLNLLAMYPCQQTATNLSQMNCRRRMVTPLTAPPKRIVVAMWLWQQQPCIGILPSLFSQPNFNATSAIGARFAKSLLRRLHLPLLSENHRVLLLNLSHLPGFLLLSQR